MSAYDLNEIERLLVRLPGGELGHGVRQQALAQFRRTGFPNRSMEQWRYTDLKPISEGPFALVPPTAEPQSDADIPVQLLAEAHLEGTASRWVFLNGRFAPELSHNAAVAGLSVHCQDHPTREPALDSRQTARPTLESRHALGALNTALTTNLVNIEIAAHTKIEAPLHLLFIATSSEFALQPRIQIELADHAGATVLIQYASAPGMEGWTNAVCEIDMAANAALELYELQEHDRAYTHTGLIKADLSRDAEFRLRQIGLGGGLARHDVDIGLCEPGACTELLGLVFAEHEQHIDTQIQVAHLAPDTRSEQAYRGIVGERSRAIVNGKVVVHRDAQGIDANQSINGLILAEHAEFDAKPELEIYADNVKCSHGTSVGEIDAEQLFYLCARGIAQEDARRLLTFAFANTLLRRMESRIIRERVARKLAGTLLTGPDMETLL